MNLLTNAAKYTTDGGSIDVTLQQEGDEAVLRVRDSGVGIYLLLPGVGSRAVQESRLRPPSGETGQFPGIARDPGHGSSDLMGGRPRGCRSLCDGA